MSGKKDTESKYGSPPWPIDGFKEVVMKSRAERRAKGLRVCEAGEIAADKYPEAGVQTDSIPIDTDDLEHRLPDPDEGKEFMN